MSIDKCNDDDDYDDDEDEEDDDDDNNNNNNNVLLQSLSYATKRSTKFEHRCNRLLRHKRQVYHKCSVTLV